MTYAVLALRLGTVKLVPVVVSLSSVAKLAAVAAFQRTR